MTVNLLFLNSVSVYFQRSIVEWFKSEKVLFATKKYFIYVFFCAIFVTVCLFSFNIVASNKLNIIYFFLALSISTINRNLLSSYNVLGYQKQFVVISCLLSTISISLAFLYVSFFENSAIGWLLGVVSSELIIFPIICKFFFSVEHKISKVTIQDKPKQYLLTVIKFCVPILISNIMMWGQTYYYRFYVEENYGLDVLGGLALGIGVTSAAFVALESIIQQIVYPAYLRDVNGINDIHSVKEKWGYYATPVIFIYISFGVLLIYLMPLVTKFLLGSGYASAYKYAVLAIGTELFRVLINAMLWVAYSQKVTKYSIPSYTAGVMVLFLALINISSPTVFEVQYLLIISSLVAFLFHLYFLKKYLSICTQHLTTRLLSFSLPFVIFLIFETIFGLNQESSLFSFFITSVVLLVWAFSVLFSFSNVINRLVNKEVS
ncbi:TPA: hypothetical protein P0E26_002154 [Vibrio harveyi]|nr:hypothetical protein [Vibrio harveyi]